MSDNCLLVKVSAAALNPLDIKLATSIAGYAIPGLKGVGKDFCGVIEKVGANCDASKWKVGDRVCGKLSTVAGPGTVSTYLAIDPTEEPVLVVPDNISDVKAAALPLTYETAYECLTYGGEDHAKGANVLILGGSTGCGIFAIQLAKQEFNAVNVTATCSPSKFEFVKDLGADVCIDYTGDIVAQLRESLATTGKKFDIVIDCVGGNEVLESIDDFLEPKSTGSFYATIVGSKRAAGSYSDLGGPLAYLYMPDMLKHSLQGNIRYIVRGVPKGHTWQNVAPRIISRPEFKIIVDSEYKLDDWKQAWDRMASRHALGKVVIKID